MKAMGEELEREFLCKIEVFKGTPGCWKFRHTHPQGRMPAQERHKKTKFSPLADSGLSVAGNKG